MTAGVGLVPLADRSAGMQRTRVLLAAVVVGATFADGGVLTGPVTDLVSLSGLYVLITALVEVLRRLTGRRCLQLLSSALVLDGLYLAVVIAGTGGPTSRLLFLVHIHIVGSALLLSFRTGLIASVGHGLLLLAASHLHLGGSAGTATNAGTWLAAASFLLVAGATAVFARLNERELDRSRRSATALVALSSDLQRCRTAHEVALTGASHLRGRLAHLRAAVLLQESGRWVGAVDAGRGPVQVDVPAAGTISLGEVRTLLLAELDATAAPVLNTVLPDARHVVVVPLVVDGETVGVAAVECGQQRSRMATTELELVEQSAARLALSVHTVQLLREVERLAASDPLTGLPNRRLFEATLERELARVRRNGAPLALALVDVDHFKAVNDEHGHQAGDEVLRELAGALSGAVRQEDVVARYGGEEFVVLLPDASGDAAVVVAERLRAAARTVRRLPVTISVGVAALDAGADGVDLVAAADAALYRAKAEGRDRVVRAEARLVSAS